MMYLLACRRGHLNLNRSLAGSSVAPHLTLLRRVGFCRLEGAAGAGDGRGAWHRLHWLYCVFALLAICGYWVQQGIYAYENRRDMSKLVPVLFLMLCHLTCIVKQVVFHVDARRIDQIIAGLNEAAFNSRAPQHRAMLQETAVGALRLLRPYVGCGIATCVLWAMLPIIYRLQGHQVQFPFWMPGNYNQPSMFPIVLLYSFYATTLVAAGNTTMDAFIATILSQCKTQIRILRMNFEDLPARARQVATDSASYEAALSELFLDCIKHFQKISEMMEQLLSVFGLAVLVQFAVGGWILCMAAYKLVSVNVFSFDFASTTLFLVCILTELFLYCYYGNEVSDESDRVVQSIYSMEWLHTPLRFKRSLLITMERAKRPLRPTAGHLIPLSLDTFVTIMKSSYSFYAVLRQTK